MIRVGQEVQNLSAGLSDSLPIRKASSDNVTRNHVSKIGVAFHKVQKGLWAHMVW